MKGVPAIWFGLLLLGLLTALSFWIERAVQPPPPKRDGSTRHDPDYTVYNFSTVRSDLNGNPRYDLTGAEMRHYPDDDSTDLVKPNYAIYAQKKQVTRVQSERGQVSSNGENVYFMDNVKVTRAATAGKGEMTVMTSYLHVIPDKEIAQTDRPVTILQAPRTIVTANGMLYDKKQGLLNLRNKVRVHYVRPAATGGKPMTIEQVVGDRKFLDHGLSTVKPASEVMPALPVKPIGEKVKVEPKKATLVTPKTQQGKAAGGVKKAPVSHTAVKKTAPKKDPAAKQAKKKTKNDNAKSATSKNRVRRRYENP